ncbi:cytochrome P450 85A1-like isoform X2 [Rhododendron vialii]|uniref:cytochrome P450 85A1-like isoform X2 n=1 Tax=Rhododendron vialii TaxID=182163 RepID=UPI00265E2FFB|nr:cytochrome P450 85A1-like isoform X2 [Rhododendron vialii]
MPTNLLVSLKLEQANTTIYSSLGGGLGASLGATKMAVFVVGLGVVLGLCFCTALLRWNEVRYRKKGLPPGTMGWPIFGETSEFLKQGPNFMKKQRARYGSFFKSHILGCPTIVSMDPELNRYILMNESKGLVPGYPQSMLDILGKCNIAAVHGLAHRHMRGALLALVSSNVIRDRLLPKIDGFMRSHLSNWEDKVIDVQEKTKEMALLSSLNQIAGLESIAMSQEFMLEFFKLVLGTLSLPINLPGTNYHCGFQARKNIVKMLTRLVDERRASGEIQHDMLGVLMNGEENRWKLSDEEIIDQMITILYSGYETVSTTSMMAVKYLQDHPNVLRELRKEHLAIRQGKRPEDPIDWEDFKAMRFTRAVIFETSRLATIVNGVLRKTTQDMELNGFLIPKGWRIYVYTREINYNPCLYPEPFTFNPWRWMDKSSESQNYFFLFGGGSRHCPGKELGIAEISTFLHYFVTRYRWEEVGGEKLMKFPRVEAPNGLHIRVSSYSTDNHLSCVQKKV